jgi:hypothetical protein
MPGRGLARMRPRVRWWPGFVPSPSGKQQCNSCRIAAQRSNSLFYLFKQHFNQHLYKSYAGEGVYGYCISIHVHLTYIRILDVVVLFCWHCLKINHLGAMGRQQLRPKQRFAAWKTPWLGEQPGITVSRLLVDTQKDRAVEIAVE